VEVQCVQEFRFGRGEFAAQVKHDRAGRQVLLRTERIRRRAKQIVFFVPVLGQVPP
jgi:hypothetical protein